MIVRPERPEDLDSIARLVEAAFGRPFEARVVERIRASGNYEPELTFVAEQDGDVVGHVMLSYMPLDDKRILVLAPLAVRPDRQNERIGDALTRYALERADERGEPLVLLLGHPSYYPRFGFEPAGEHGFEPASPALQVRRLSAYDPSYRGTVVWPPAFDEA